MGHQLRFYLAPEDLLQAEQHLRAALGFEVLACRSPSDVVERLPGLAVHSMGHEVLRVHLCRPEDVRKIVLVRVPEQGYWIVDSARSPAIEVDRCFLDAKLLRRGRLYRFTHGATGPRPIETSDFERWARRVFSVFRKGLAHDAGLEAWLGPRATELRASGLSLTYL